MSKRTKVYTMEVTVTIMIPDGYEPHIDEYGECECEDVCYSAVSQHFGSLCRNSPSVKGRDARWFDVWTECEKPVLYEDSND